MYIPNLCKRAVSHILKLFHKLGEELRLKILPSASFDDCGKDILEESG